MAEHLQRAEADHFPVPADVQDLVQGALRAVFGVVIRHNHLTDALLSLSEQLDAEQELVKDSSQYVEVVKAWRTAHRYV